MSEFFLLDARGEPPNRKAPGLCLAMVVVPERAGAGAGVVFAGVTSL